MGRKNPEERNRVFAEEAAVVQAQLALHELMEDRGWSREDLARAMNVSRARVTQIFSDECQNLTVRLLARAFFVLGDELVFSARDSQCFPVDDRCDLIDNDDASLPDDTRAWVQMESYTPDSEYGFANDNIFGGLASLRQLREEDYKLAA